MNDFTICERGISVASQEAEDFFSGLMYLARNEQLRRDLGENGKKFVIEEYDKMRLANDIKKLYRDLIKS